MPGKTAKAKPQPTKIDGRVARAEKARASRRAGLLASARQVFAARGYHSTSIDDLIDAAGVARGTFYLYFESKRAIFEALLDELFVTLQASVRRIDVGSGAAAPRAQLDAIVDQVFDTLVANREIARLLLREAVGIDADFDKRLVEFYGRIEQLLARALTTGIELGIVRRCRTDLVARAILGAVKEVVHYAFVTNGNQLVDPRSIGREVIDFTLLGVWR